MNGPGKWRWIVPAALAATLALSGSSLGAPLGQTTDFATATANAGPEGIAAGPDGNLWFPEAAANKIGEVNPATGATADFAVPTASSLPVGIAVGPNGNLWFTEFVAGKIGEINSATHAISDFPIPTASSGPVAIVQGSNGNMWFTEAAANQIGEINPTTHAFTEFSVPTLSSGPFGIASGPDDDLWFTEKSASRIGSINPRTGVAEDFPTLTASSMPNAIADGPDGSLWFTESAPAVSRIGLVNVAGHSVTSEVPATAASSPAVITPGPDGNMWFTENGNPGHIGVITAVAPAVAHEFATPTTNSAPIGIATGSDGNLWFTENANPGKVGLVGAGAAPAEAAAPAVIGTPQPGTALTCQPATWSNWAGQQPSASVFGWDGFRWLLDGAAIAGTSGQLLPVPAADVGHNVSCSEVSSYPLLGATVSAASPAVTVSPDLGASLVSTSTTATTASLTISCRGLPTQTCSGNVALTSRVTTQGSKIVAVAAKTKPKPKPPKKATRLETIASGSYSIAAGRSATMRLSLNSTGKKLLAARYRLPATLTLTGTAFAKKSVTFRYAVIRISPSYTWSFGKSFSFATELSLSHLPKDSRVTLSCQGHGCPFAKKTFPAPKKGRLGLASALKKRHLSPHSTVQIQITAPNEVGEVVVFTIQSGKSPRESFLCIPPGARSPRACVHP